MSDPMPSYPPARSPEVATRTPEPTPGTWEYGCHPGNPNLHIVKPVMFGRWMGKLPECEGGHSYTTNEADAHLWAASKEMLSACERLLMWNRDHRPVEGEERVHAAIIDAMSNSVAKAKGRLPHVD